MVSDPSHFVREATSHDRKDPVQSFTGHGFKINERWILIEIKNKRNALDKRRGCVRLESLR